MDTHTPQFNSSSLLSRASQSSPSPSPSHSTTSSAHNKRKISAIEDHPPTLPPPTSDSDEEDNDHDQSSMRNFTSARLSENNNNTNNTTDSINVKVENNEVAVSLSEAVRTGGAYSAREESLKREEAAGRLKFECYRNDGIDEHMVWLIGLKNIFSRQLPNMPREYIVRLVMDRSHKSVMVIRENHVVGGITYRPYISQKFGEIAFCAIASDEQVKGYGTRLMNHLKQQARDVDGLTHFLTYADNNAVGYFAKQGFTKEIDLEKDRWLGYIKDYDGGILMQCKIDPKLPYTDLSTMVFHQRQVIDERIRELSKCHIIYPGIDFQKKEAGIPKRLLKIEDIPGLSDAGWTPDQWHSRFAPVSSAEAGSGQKPLTAFLRSLVKSMLDHPDAWPFKEPVDARYVPDYYDVIKDPVDLETMSKRVESEQYYVTLEMFVADAKKMFANARTYNSPDTIYYKCATRLENHFQARFNWVSSLSSNFSSNQPIYLSYTIKEFAFSAITLEIQQHI